MKLYVIVIIAAESKSMDVENDNHKASTKANAINTGFVPHLLSQNPDPPVAMQIKRHMIVSMLGWGLLCRDNNLWSIVDAGPRNEIVITDANKFPTPVKASNI